MLSERAEIFEGIFIVLTRGRLFYGLVETRLNLNPLPPSHAVRKQKKKNIFEDLFSSVLLQFKKISPLWQPGIEKFRHFSKLKISYFNGKNLSNFSQAKFQPKYLGCYELISGGTKVKLLIGKFFSFYIR